MKKLAPLLIVGILVIALAMPASGFIICPMDEPTAEELVPTIVTTTSSTIGTCEGTVFSSEDHIWNLAGSASGASVGTMDLLASRGSTAIATETSLTSQGATMTVASIKALEYNGFGAILSDAFYMSRVNQGEVNGTAPLCENVEGGSRLVFGSGAYGSELMSTIDPGAGIRASFQSGGGPSQVTNGNDQAMIGSMTVFGKTLGMYGTISECEGGTRVTTDLVTKYETRTTMNGKLNMGFTFNYDSFGA